MDKRRAKDSVGAVFVVAADYIDVEVVVQSAVV